MKGLVFDIKKFALHDGEGLRTTVFFKGCPLRCKWCQNPEGLTLQQRLWYFSNRCLGCHACIASCPQGALFKQPNGRSISIDHNKCDCCGICTDVCPTNALALDSKVYSVEELVDEVMKDRLFYEESGGGVTISGGDPTLQHECCVAFLARCKELGIHTTIETACFTSRDVIEALLPVVDTFIIDLKVYADTEHIAWTGQSNVQIKENIRYIAQQGKPLLIRVPLIPGFTATQENIRAIGEFIRNIKADIPIELLNHNHLVRDKYEKLGLTYPVKDPTRSFSKEEMDLFYSFLQEE